MAYEPNWPIWPLDDGFILGPPPLGTDDVLQFGLDDSGIVYDE